MTNPDHIMELRAELASCLCRRERAQIGRELKAALAGLADGERARATTLKSLLDEEPPA